MSPLKPKIFLPLLALALGSSLQAQSNNTRALPAENRTYDPSTPEQPMGYSLPTWWQSDYAIPDPYGTRATLPDEGVDFFGFYNAIIAGNPVGGNKASFAYADDFYFGAKLDLERLINWKGASFTLSGINRDGRSIQGNVGSQYDPMQLVGGQSIFLYGVFLEQKLLENKLSLKFGRMSASDDFATSPLYGNYLSNGIDGNIRAVLFNTRFSAYPFPVWGARLRIDPTPEFNAMVGIFQVSSRMFDPSYHGVDFSIRQGDGVLLLSQIGWTPEFFKKPVATPTSGFSKDGKSVVDEKSTMKGLKGHYFLGGYWSSWDYPQFGTTQTSPSSYGFYAHGDQMVYQEAPGSEQGLTLFNTYTFSPQQSLAIIPFQINGGAIYEGLIPGRDQDRTIFGVIYGQFSEDYSDSVAALGGSTRGYELVFEGGYRIQLNKWAYIQPDVQWVISPGGNTDVPNGLVVGAQFGLKF